MTIRIDQEGSRIWLLGGASATLPLQSSIRLANGGILTATDGTIIDLTFNSRAIDRVSPGAKVVLVGEATVFAPRNQTIDFFGCKLRELQLPAGTLLQFGAPERARKFVPPGGGGILKTSCLVQDIVVLQMDSETVLKDPMTIGASGLKLEADTFLPQSLLLAGAMVIQGSVILPSPVSMEETDTVDVWVDGCVQETYTPSTVLKQGTVLPWATLLPGGITLNAGTVITGGTTLPAGTILKAGSTLPRGTLLPAGLWLPGGTRVPPLISKHLEILETKVEVVQTAAEDEDSLADLVNAFRKA